MSKKSSQDFFDKLKDTPKGVSFARYGAVVSAAAASNQIYTGTMVKILTIVFTYVYIKYRYV